MVNENEITVEVDTDLNSLIRILEDNGFELKEVYDINDIFLINKNDKNNDKEYLSMLNKCVLIRNVIQKDKEKILLTYKHKDYNKKREIINQEIINISVDNIDNTKLLFEKLNFEELIRLNDHMLVYGADSDELVIQNVNNKHIYIEIEAKCFYTDKVYNSIEEMKEVIINNSIPIKNNDFFVKKAEVELKESFDN